ncbi:hypothetical protein [Streptomyces longispororuber]|uniref:hypothetical protein n=1 Tax=Streptomyces longispororuber TaxID=68230 RepID=UPI00210A33A9|nr:hypothetical protein [Streptomyces longispororuber]MCQ4213989.1 hypothetical protein [Streptomyces longispororuber]
MTSSAKNLLGTAETAVGKLKSTSHPDDIDRALAATHLALAASNIELTAAIVDLLKSANTSTGGIKKIADAFAKSVDELTTRRP